MANEKMATYSRVGGIGVFTQPPQQENVVKVELTELKELIEKLPTQVTVHAEAKTPNISLTVPEIKIPQINLPQTEAPHVHVAPPVVHVAAPTVNVAAPHVEIKPADIHFEPKLDIIDYRKDFARLTMAVFILIGFIGLLFLEELFWRLLHVKNILQP